MANGQCPPRGGQQFLSQQGGYVPPKATINIPAQGNVAIFDIPLEFPNPTKRIMLTALSNHSFGLYLSSCPSGYQNTIGSDSFEPSGAENWIQIHTAENGDTVYPEGSIFEFPQAQNTFYLSFIGSMAGQPFLCTFVDATGFNIFWKPQLSGIA